MTDVTRWFELTRLSLVACREQALKRNPTFCGLLAVLAVLVALPIDIATLPATLIGIAISARINRRKG